MDKFRARSRRRLTRGVYCNEEIRGDFRCGLAMEVTLKNCRFVECRLDGINFSGSKMTNCSFESCTLNGAILNASILVNCEFLDCQMDMARFDAAILQNCKLKGGRAEYSSFLEASIMDSLLDLQLHGADLRFADSRNVDYGDSNLWGVSFNASCAQFVANKLSERQIDLLLGLLAQAASEERRREIEAIVPAKSLETLQLLVGES